MDTKTLMTLKDTDQISRKENLLASEIDDEVIMLDEESGSYYGLNPVASQIWIKLETPLSFFELRQQLLEIYETTDEQCRQDTLTFLQSMMDRGLISVKD
jgi:hypothetical protein